MHIEDERVIKYMSRVLRMKIHQECLIQWQGINATTRWHISLIDIAKNKIVARIIDCKKNVKYLSNIDLLVALPNTFSKCEFIVQKCTEVWVDAIYFWRWEKSIIPTISEKRMQRLQTIALESVEQCKRRSVPTIGLLDNPRDICRDKKVVAFDFVEGEAARLDSGWGIVWVVGPEWHFGQKDYLFLREVGYIPCSLGDHVLRTETAAIVGAWYLCNIIK